MRASADAMAAEHPLAERLAAYADGDCDALTDAPLRAHVASCERCALVVRDLGALRIALADLPDLVPSRPLRFVPPVEAAAAAPSGFAGLVRRLFAPALVAGAALVVVGSVGMAAPTATAFSPARSALRRRPGHGERFEHRGRDRRAGVPARERPRSRPAVAAGGDSGVPVPRVGGGSTVPQSRRSGPRGHRTTPAAPMPWLAITIIGAAIVIASLILRWTVLPAAGFAARPSSPYAPAASFPATIAAASSPRITSATMSAAQPESRNERSSGATGGGRRVGGTGISPG